MRKCSKTIEEWSFLHENGYFTVEAAMVLPMVMGMMLLLIYLLVFQYNRCILELDFGTLAMWGSVLQERDEEAIREQIGERISEINLDKYIAWEMLEINVSVEKNCFQVESCGQIEFPVSGLNFWNSENVWSARAEYTYERKSPVEFIRMCNRILEMTDAGE